MKSTKLMTLGVLIGTCALASAQDTPPAGGPPGGGPPPGGKREIPAAILKKFDKDGDGKISDDERTAMKADMEAKHNAMLEKYDADKNGKLDPEEAQAAIAAGEKLPPMRGPGGGKGPGGKGGKSGKGDKSGPGAPPEGGAPPPPQAE